MNAGGRVPDESLATAIAGRVVGRPPTGIRRFATGSSHYVYEALFGDRDPVVLRIGGEAAHAEMAGARRLSGLLRPRGVPLPAILGEDLGADLPWLVLQRLPGSDLGAVVAGLSDGQLERIAAGVASAQAIVAATGSAGLYGYAAVPERAPQRTWSRVLEDNLDRSRKRIVSAGLFDPRLVDRGEAAVAAARDRLDRMPATPFLHDTTTKNVIVAPDGSLSGIVDVDDLCFGDPRYAAALTLAALSGYGGPSGYVEHWLRHAGAEDDAMFRLYVVVLLLDLMGEHGNVFNGNQRRSTAQARASLMGALQANLRLIAA